MYPEKMIYWERNQIYHFSDIYLNHYDPPNQTDPHASRFWHFPTHAKWHLPEQSKNRLGTRGYYTGQARIDSGAVSCEGV